MLTADDFWHSGLLMFEKKVFQCLVLLVLVFLVFILAVTCPMFSWQGCGLWCHDSWGECWKPVSASVWPVLLGSACSNLQIAQSLSSQMGVDCSILYSWKTPPCPQIRVFFGASSFCKGIWTFMKMHRNLELQFKVPKSQIRFVSQQPVLCFFPLINSCK